MSNNMLWLIVVPAASTTFGLLAAQLTDRISWGNIAKSLIFMPMAISFVGASVIFKLVYDTRAVGQEQNGILNAIWLNFDGGIGSILMLKILPAILLLGFAAITAYAVKAVLTPLRNAYVQENMVFKVLRIAGTFLGAFLVVKSLLSIAGLFTTTLTYGEPQTWLTIPFWNSFF